MSKSEQGKRNINKAVALQYSADDAAPVIVASGMGYMAEKIIETASDCGVPIYEDNSLATILTQLQLGQEIPENLYQAIVEIYVYFLHFDLNKKEVKPEEKETQQQPQPEQTNEAAETGTEENMQEGNINGNEEQK